MCIREGVDNLKINISGDEFVTHCKAEMTVMMDDEIRTAVDIAHDFGKQIACHARAAGSVKRAVRNGVDVIYHCDFADEEALDLLESVKDRIFVGPAVGLLHNTLYEAEAFGMTPEFSKSTKVLAANQGLYNGFLAAGLIWGIWLGEAGDPVKIFFLLCVAVAGAYGAATVSMRILMIQTIPALIALVAVIYM